MGATDCSRTELKTNEQFYSRKIDFSSVIGEIPEKELPDPIW